MNYTVYIQSVNGIPLDDWGFVAYLGFRRRQMDIVFYEDIMEVPARTTSIVVGCIEDTKKFFERLSITCPLPLNIPEELSSYIGREIKLMQMGTFKQQTNLPIFVKPQEKVKSFIAGVITQQSSRRDFFNDVPDDEWVMTSEVVDIISEYRGFVIDKELKSLQHYAGDFCIYPDCSIIKKAISDYKYSPAGYSIDFGVTSEGKTILIECNDGWSLGSYGCEPTIYVKLLLKRWLELVK